MAKKAKEKEIGCKNCKYYINGECDHKDNTGTLMQDRKIKKFFVKSASLLEKDCKNFKENDI